jgi:hypothetical protein
MAQDIFKPWGPIKASQPTAGGANIFTTPVMGVVKDNVDPIRAGRLRVYISTFSGMNPDDHKRWIVVRYMSNFFGHVRPTSPDEGDGKYLRNPSSYGEWHAPPDIGTSVICIFVDGDINKGYYIGSVLETDILHMVPAVSGNIPEENQPVIFNNAEEASTYGGAKILPLTGMNTNDEERCNAPGYLNNPRPVHSYTAGIMKQQGIIRDPIRGPVRTSSQRETPSRVGWGVSSPGRPIYEGGYTDEDLINNLSIENSENLRVISRRGGHSIVMDDGDLVGQNQMIRLRTTKGHQILMSDDGHTMMFLHGNGQSYIELGKEGTVDVYATNSVNIRAHGDLNFHADRDIGIHAGRNLNIYSENMHVTTDKDLKQHVGGNLLTSVMKLCTTQALGALTLSSIGSAALESAAATYINGSLINLNTGITSSRPIPVAPVQKILHPDTVYTQDKGFVVAPEKIKSVASRVPAHAPWAHANLGVDAIIDLGGGQVFSTPSPEVAAATEAGLNSGQESAPTATAVSVPPGTA